MNQIGGYSRKNGRHFSERLWKVAPLCVATACVSIGVAMLVWGCQSEQQFSAYHNMPSGERLYRARCASCHMLVAPESHSDPEWAFYVEKYGRNMSPTEKQLVIAYLRQAN